MIIDMRKVDLRISMYLLKLFLVLCFTVGNSVDLDECAILNKEICEHL